MNTISECKEMAGLKNNLLSVTRRVALLEKFAQTHFGDIFWDFVRQRAELTIDSDVQLATSTPLTQNQSSLNITSTLAFSNSCNSSNPNEQPTYSNITGSEKIFNTTVACIPNTSLLPANNIIPEGEERDLLITANKEPQIEIQSPRELVVVSRKAVLMALNSDKPSDPNIPTANIIKKRSAARRNKNLAFQRESNLEPPPDAIAHRKESGNLLGTIEKAQVETRNRVQVSIIPGVNKSNLLIAANEEPQMEIHSPRQIVVLPPNKAVPVALSLDSSSHTNMSTANIIKTRRRTKHNKKVTFQKESNLVVPSPKVIVQRKVRDHFIVANEEPQVEAQNPKKQSFPVSPSKACEGGVVAGSTCTRRKSRSPVSAKYAIRITSFQPRNKSVVKERIYKCHVCGKCLTSSGSLKKHINYHSGVKPYECPHCLKRLFQKSNLTAHERRHTAGLLFKCNICFKDFTCKHGLETHMRVHTGEKPYKCTLCIKSFSQFPNLNTHIRGHKNENPHKCTFCVRTFAANASLENHLRVHTGESPFECRTCHKSFKQKETLTKHKKIHNPSYH